MVVKIVDRMKAITGDKKNIELAKRLDKAVSSVGSWAQRDVIPLNELVSFGVKTGASIDWLVNGDGLPFKTKELNQKNANLVLSRLPVPFKGELHSVSYVGESAEGKPQFQVSPIVSESSAVYEGDGSVSDLVEIPQLDLGLAAGSGQYAEDNALSIRSRRFERQWLQKKGINPAQVALLRVEGDSMYPTLKDKDVVMIDRSRTQINSHLPFAIYYDECLYLKMIQKKGNGKIVLNSFNSLYKPIEIELNDSDQQDIFRVIGACVWHAHSWV